MRSGLLRLMVVGTTEGIVMIEAGGSQVQEQTIVDAIEFGHSEIKKICAAINQLRERVGRPKRAFTAPEVDESYYKQLSKKIESRLSDALDTKKHPKAESYDLVKAYKKELVEALPEEDTEGREKLAKYYELVRERIFRDQVIAKKRRPDGRAFDEIRPISIEVGVLPRTHGSAIFTRGETQALVTTTLGTSE